MTRWLLSLLLLLIGMGIGYWLATSQIPSQEVAIPVAKECKPLFYRHPMNPEITSPVPAKDEMGMDYIPVYPEGCPGAAPKAEPGVVAIDPQIVQQIGVKTARVERRTIGHEIKTIGRVAFDETRIVRLHPKVEGWVEQLYVSKTESFVVRNQPLLSLYSPLLVATQEEFLVARQNLEVLKTSPLKEIRESASRLVEAARERLRLFDVPQHQIRELERRGVISKSLHIHAPTGGIVVQIHAREGQHVTPQTPLYTLVDLEQVWVYADLYEQDLPWVRIGDPALFESQALPGRRLRGQIDDLYPTVDPKSRTVRARIVFENRDLLLKPEMFGTVRIQGKPREATVVPREAVLFDGDRSYVLIALGHGKFKPKEVEIGVKTRDWIEIRSGLSVGEEVVVSGQFLIDSESRLKAALQKLTPHHGGGGETHETAPEPSPGAAPGKTKTGHHGGDDHD